MLTLFKASAGLLARQSATLTACSSRAAASRSRLEACRPVTTKLGLPQGSVMPSTRLVSLGPAGAVLVPSMGAQRPLTTASKPASSATFPASFVPFRATPPELIPESVGPAIRPRDLPRLACQRASPLICPNQQLIEELAVIWHFRRIRGEPGPVLDRHELAFEKAISSIKALPTRLVDAAEVVGLPFVGPKIGAFVGEWIETGKIEQAQELRTDDRLRACMLFQTLHSIGPLRARDLYDRHNCRSLVDVYAIDPETQLEVDYWEELNTPIPRAEVSEIAETIARELEQVSPGCELTICGGFRRGKLSLGDVDLVFSHRTNPDAVTLVQLNRLLDRMIDRGLVTAELSGGTHEAGSRLWQKYLVFRLPHEEGAPKRLRRRVDVVLAPFENYATAVLGWTGSTAFERSLRDRAKQLKMSFDSSNLTSLATGARFRDVDPAGGEEALFEKLGLDWIEPTLRNADV